MAEPIEDRYRVLDEMREQQPVYYDPASRSLVLTRFADARALLGDGALWKDADRAEEGSMIRAFKPVDMNRPGDRDSGIGWMDNPDHSRVRPPIAMAMAKRLATLRPIVGAIVTSRLDALEGRDVFDVLGDFAVPIPVATIGHLLGVDTSDLASFRAWSEAAINVFLANPSPQQRAETKAASDAILDYLDLAMARRRAAPGDDLISDLLAVQARDGTLSDSEIRVNCMNLLLGGNVTTADLIGNAAWLLLTHPGEREKLRADPALINGAIEEVLRFAPPTEGAQRVASHDFEIHGCPVHTGQVVAVLIHAANRDPAVFTDPHRFNISRKDGPHVAFGGGAHICIGASLARLEAQTAIRGLFARFPDLGLAAPESPPQWRDMPFFRGLESLAVARRRDA